MNILFTQGANIRLERSGIEVLIGTSRERMGPERDDLFENHRAFIGSSYLIQVFSNDCQGFISA